MKFRIMEKRGKFRIEHRFPRKPKQSNAGCITCLDEEPTIGRSYRSFGKVVEKHFLTSNKWLGPDTEVVVTRQNPSQDFYLMSDWLFLTESDTYKQAEAYIKKHYGLEGVKAIEEPEWRVV